MTQHVLKLACDFSPSSGLVNTLCDEVCWKRVLKLAPVFEWVMHLGVGHAATLEPAVEDLGDPLKLAFSTAGWDG